MNHHVGVQCTLDGDNLASELAEDGVIFVYMVIYTKRDDLVLNRAFRVGFAKAKTFSATLGYLTERGDNIRRIKAFGTQQEGIKTEYRTALFSELTAVIVQAGTQFLSIACIAYFLHRRQNVA